MHQRRHPSRRAAVPGWARSASAAHHTVKTPARQSAAAAECATAALRDTPLPEWRDQWTHAPAPAACIDHPASATTAHARPWLRNTRSPGSAPTSPPPLALTHRLAAPRLPAELAAIDRSLHVSRQSRHQRNNSSEHRYANSRRPDEPHGDNQGSVADSHWHQCHRRLPPPARFPRDPRSFWPSAR